MVRMVDKRQPYCSYAAAATTSVVSWRGRERGTDRSMMSRRTHYQGLDFLRGVAALAVVEFHLSAHLAIPSLFSHGYLAVDCLLLLSGFVIAHAYSDRLSAGGMSFSKFFSLRATRLLPLVVLGTVIAAVIDIGRPGQVSVGQHLSDIGIATVMGVLCLPTLWHTTLEYTIFPLDTPVWSLFFELVANFAFVPLVQSRHARRTLLSVTAASAILLLLGIIHYSSADLGATANGFIVGFPRVGWSFAIGVLLTRAKPSPIALSKWAYAAVLCAIMAVPQLPGGWNELFDAAVIFAIFPLVVFGAANCQKSRKPSPLAVWSGNISYPLYVIHYPLVRVIGTVSKYLPGTPAIHLGLALGSTAGLVALSAAVYSFYDVPLRAGLSARLKARKPVSQPGLLDSPAP